MLVKQVFKKVSTYCCSDLGFEQANACLEILHKQVRAVHEASESASDAIGSVAARGTLQRPKLHDITGELHNTGGL